MVGVGLLQEQLINIHTQAMAKDGPAHMRQ